MTRSNLYVTLSDGDQLVCVCDSSSAPEQGFIVETLILPLLGMNDPEKEKALLTQYCAMNEQRVNATYRYALNLPKKRVRFFEETYQSRTDTFRCGTELTDRYLGYLKIETESEQQVRQRFKRYTNAALIKRANRLPDFKWDDEGLELQRRFRVANGAFIYEMQGNTLVILNDE
jgi:hypothetical protein